MAASAVAAYKARGRSMRKQPSKVFPELVTKSLDCKAFYNTFEVQAVVAALILANFVTNIVEKQVWPTGNPSVPGGRSFAKIFGLFELFYNVSFTLELAMNMYAHWLAEFWRSGWNVFDFATVSISWLFQFDLPLPGPLRLMRMVRALRVFRLFKRVKSLRKILESLARAVPGVINAFLIMLIVMCIYAILAVDFFSAMGNGGEMDFEWCQNDQCPAYYTSRGNDFGHEYFGTFFKALYTMFQILTGDSWSEAIGRPLIDNWGPAATGFYFVSFYLLHAVVLINVVVAVLLEKMVEDDDIGDDDGEDDDDDDGSVILGNLKNSEPHQTHGGEHIGDSSPSSEGIVMKPVAGSALPRSESNASSGSRRRQQTNHSSSKSSDLDRLIRDLAQLKETIAQIQQNQLRILERLPSE